MPTLTKLQIIEAQDIQKELVKVPEWGGDVYVKMMTGKERDTFESSLFETKGDDRKQNLVNMRARLAAMTIVDDNGTRLFSDDDVNALGKKSARALDRIFKVAQKLNGIGADAVEELTKN